MTTLAGIRTHLTRVVRAEQVTPRTRRVTLGGDDLADFRSLGGDQFVYVLLPPPGRAELSIDRDFTWDRYRGMPAADRPVGAYYTVRHHRPEVGEVDVDIVLHDSGAGASFGRSAAPGDPVALWGPRGLHRPPASVSSFLLVGDDTAVPAVSVLAETAPPGTAVRALLEVHDEHEERPIGGSADVTWLHRRDGRNQLVDAVRALGPLPSGTYVWGGAERDVVGRLRDLVADLPEDHVCLTAYWVSGSPARRRP